MLPYEESSRVPLIIYDPRSEKKAVRCNVATGNIDLAATILDAALGRPNHGNGTSLLKHYANNNNLRRDRIIPLINVWGPEQVFSLGFVKGEWKYIYWPYTGDGMKATAEMYNLKEDPSQLVDLASEKVAKLTELKADWDAYAQRYALTLPNEKVGYGADEIWREEIR